MLRDSPESLRGSWQHVLPQCLSSPSLQQRLQQEPQPLSVRALPSHSTAMVQTTSIWKAPLTLEGLSLPTGSAARNPLTGSSFRRQ